MKVEVVEIGTNEVEGTFEADVLMIHEQALLIFAVSAAHGAAKTGSVFCATFPYTLQNSLASGPDSKKRFKMGSRTQVARVLRPPGAATTTLATIARVRNERMMDSLEIASK